MIGFIWRQLRTRPRRPIALGVVVLAASAAFVLLTSTAKTTDIRVEGSVKSNFRNAYDILVRPRGSFTPTERREGLVRENYLSGIFGGISLEQWQRIKEIPGVDVAAPIANLGYVLPHWKFGIRLNHVLNEDPVQLYRIRLTWIGQRGLSRYPDNTRLYTYYTRKDRFSGVKELVPGHRDPLEVCYGIYKGRPISSGPFDRRASAYISCYSQRSPEAWAENVGQKYGVLRPDDVGVLWDASFPLLIAAIDPASEAALMRLDRAVTSGRYLRPDDGPQILPQQEGGEYRAIPVLASTKSFVDEQLEIDVERLRIRRPNAVPEMLASRAAYRFLSGLHGKIVDRRRLVVGPLYQRMLARQQVHFFSYWTVSNTRYRTVSPTRLAAIATTNPKSIWRTPLQSTQGGYWPAPPSNADVQFRRLRPFVGSNVIGAQGVVRTPGLNIVGRFDPSRLPGFSPLSRLPMETYYPPELAPGDEEAHRALNGRPLLPTQNLGDFIQQPPLVLTTLEGMKPFLNPVFFFGAKGKAKAPISVIRVRVRGVRGPDALSQERIRRVAIAIRDKTGLDVDITAGSSPRRILVDLPPGKFGRPALTLEEGWVKKGVSVSFLRALDHKRLGLFTLILVASAFFVANGAFAVVRSRRVEIGTLLCLGWSPKTIFRVVLGEIALIGVAAGVVGTIVAGGAAAAVGLEVSARRAAVVVPVAVALAVAAGLVPAWRAGQSVPLDAVRPTVAGEVGGRRIRSLAALALVNVRRAPARSIVAAAGLFVGVAGLTILVAVNRAFQGTLVGTLLGEAISVQIRGLDFLAVGFIISMAALSLTDVVFLNMRERAPELAALRAVGWQDSHLAALVAGEAVWLGVLSSGAGGLVGTAVAVQLAVPLGPVSVAAALGVLGGIFVSLLASVVPVARLSALTPASVLAQE